MAKERRKTVQAGRLWMAVQYTALHSQNQAARRDARALISTPAREALNAKLSWQKLMLILATNFGPSDLVVTLTYRDGNLPGRREDANRRLSNFIRALRQHRRAQSEPLLYARITEGYHSDGRLHHHLILNATGQDFDIIRKLWASNGDNVDFEQFGINGAERWAKYLTKEPREKGRRYVGDRTWTTSRNLKKPITTYEYVPQEQDLAPPPGSIVTDKTEVQNSYGRFRHMIALLPDSEK